MLKFIYNTLISFIKLVKIFFKVILIFLNLTRFDFYNLSNDIVINNEKNLLSHIFYLNRTFSKKLNRFIFNQKTFFIIDLVYIFLKSLKYRVSSNETNLFRSYLRLFNTNIGFFFNFKHLKNNYYFLKVLKSIFLSGIKSIWFGFRLWLIPLFVGFLIIYYSMVLRCIPFNKIVMFWIIFGMIAYWLFSGFVFFIKKYQFSKYTSAIQRFWRRSYILFWLIEFSLFIVYFYLTLNANQESFYMFDQIQVFKTHLFSWRSFFLKIFPLTLLLLLCYFLILSLKWNIINKNSLILTIITIIIVNVVWVEFYQFFHVVNFYGNFNWIYESDEKIWSLELESRKTRTVNHYVMLLLILKFWHIVFIVAFWFFFLLRSFEIGRLRYPMLSANLQNFLILYLFAWVNMFPWLKFIFRRYIDMPYYWFYVNNKDLAYRVFFNDMKLLYFSLTDFSFYKNYNFIIKYSFINWYVDDCDYVSSYRKSLVKNIILHSLEY